MTLTQSFGSVTYPPLPTPIQTFGTNWASFDDNGWFTDSTWVRCPALNVFADTTITHQGQPTFRVELDSSGSGNSGADHWGPTIKPGDHVVMSCWMKTGGSAAVPYAGARMGFDIYGSDGRITGVHSLAQAADGCRTPSTDSSIDTNYVHWGSDWTLRTWDFIVPSTYISDGGSASINKNYASGSTVTPVNMVPWIQVWGSTYPNNIYTCYFSDFQLHIT